MVDISFNLNNFEYFILILVRISAFVVVAPFFGQRGIPNQIKIGLAAIVSILMYNILDRPELDYTSVIGFASIVVIETVVGLTIGFAANICSSIITFAGNIIDMDIGLSMASEFNPEMNAQVTISGNFYYYTVLLLLIASNMHSYVLRAICDSYSVVPIGGAVINWESMFMVFARFMTDLFVIAFRIFLPYFACIMVLNCILGIMAKVAPQMNMFSVGIQLKLITGMVVMFLTIFMLPNIADFLFREIKTMVVLVIESMY